MGDAFGQAYVAGGGIGVGVTELFLHAAQVQPGLDEVGGVTVTQAVDGDVFADAAVVHYAGKGVLCRALVHDAKRGSVVWTRAPRKDQRGMTMPAPLAAQYGEGEVGQDDEAIVVAFAVADMQTHVCCVDVGDGEAEGFAQAQAHAVGDEPEGLIAMASGAADEAGDFIAGEDIGQGTNARWLDHVDPREGLTEHVLVEEADAVTIDFDGAEGWESIRSLK